LESFPGAIASMIGASSGHSGSRYTSASPKTSRPSEDFPLPEGPTMTPISQSLSSMGSSASRAKLAPDSALKRDFTRAAR